MASQNRGSRGPVERRGVSKSPGRMAVADMGIGKTKKPVLQGMDEPPLPDATSDETGEKLFIGSCRGNCIGGCALNIHVRNGKVVKTSPAKIPNPLYRRICLKGLSHPQRIYDPDRLKYPLKRVGKRGAGKWKRISWDEAIGTICTKWKKLKTEYGDYSPVVFYHVGANSGALAMYSYLPLENLLGSSNVSMGADTAGMRTATMCLGLGPTWCQSELTVTRDAKTVVFWGANFTSSYLQPWRFNADARENGAIFIAIDPNVTTTADKSDIHVTLRPGTDAALALAMANVVVREDLIDKEFLKKASVAPLLVKASDGKYLRRSDLTGKPSEKNAADPFIVWNRDKNTHGLTGDVSNPSITGSYTISGFDVTTTYDLLLSRIAEYTPEKASRICDVPVTVIEKVARLIATNGPTTINTGYGFDRYTNGQTGYFSIITLLILTGNLGKTGAAYGVTYALDLHYTNSQKWSKPPESLPRITMHTSEFPKAVRTSTYAGKPINLKSLFVYNGNPLNAVCDQNAWKEAVNKLDLVVVADTRMTTSAMYADIVLPVTHWFEYQDFLGMGFPLPYIVIQEKAIDAPFECKSDFEIANLLGKEMGFGDYYDKTDEEVLAHLLDTPAAKAFGISWEELKKKKFIRNLPGEVYIHGEGGTFPTPTGRAQFYIENPAPTISFGQTIDLEKEKWPRWEPPTEVYEGNPLKEEFPLSFFQEHTHWRTHGQFSHVSWIRELDPEPVVKMNPQDAAERNIRNGDIVKIHNNRGYVVIKAVIDNGLRPGMVNSPWGWQEDQYIDGHIQSLTPGISNQFMLNGAYNDTLVEITKMETED